MAKLIVELPEELYARLKRQAAEEHKTLKAIVTTLLHSYLLTPRHGTSRRATGLCGSWKGRETAEQLARAVRRLAAGNWKRTHDSFRAMSVTSNASPNCLENLDGAEVLNPDGPSSILPPPAKLSGADTTPGSAASNISELCNHQNC